MRVLTRTPATHLVPITPTLILASMCIPKSSRVRQMISMAAIRSQRSGLWATGRR
ncbi:unnamed protein product [Linum tenue]|uniref:Uncharacterized protein n=1 Tax=Linum tenue TaxID=586396 RepID=A0AAV0RM38_9ROSI|nr:unnamed protein product [Linum tenue]